MTEIPPPLIPDNSDEPFADTTYTEGEIEAKDYDKLASIAAEHPDDDIHGRMDKATLKAELVGRERV